MVNDQEEYCVRYGNQNGVVDRTFWDTLSNTTKTYDKLKLDNKVTWKELIYSPFDGEDENDKVIKSDEVQILIMGNAQFIIHKNLL